MTKQAGSGIGVRVLILAWVFLFFLIGSVIYETNEMITDITFFIESYNSPPSSDASVLEIEDIVKKRGRQFLSFSLMGLLCMTVVGLLISFKDLFKPIPDDEDIDENDDTSLAELKNHLESDEDSVHKMLEAINHANSLEKNPREATFDLDLAEDTFPEDMDMSGDTPLTNSYNRMVEALQKINDLEKKHSIELADANTRLEKEIYDRKRAEKEIRYLSRQLINSTEEAQKKLAQDLHDEFGQTLAALHMDVETLRKTMPDEMAEQKQSLGHLIDLIEQLGDKIRSISSDLRPDLLDDLGLIPTLEWYANEFMTQHTDILVDFESMGFKKRLSSEKELIFYRIMQESFNNVVKHAKAQHVQVRLTYSYPQAILMIKDNGVGFTMSSKRSGGIGLIGMRERAVSVGGTIDIRADKGKGTTIRVELPVSEKGDNNG